MDLDPNLNLMDVTTRYESGTYLPSHPWGTVPYRTISNWKDLQRHCWKYNFAVLRIRDIRIFPIPDPLSASKNLSILIQKLFLRSRKSSWIPDALRYLATVLFLPWQAFQIHQHLLAGKSSPSRRNNRFGSSWKKKKKKLLAVWLMTNELYPGIILCLNNGSINAMIRYEDG